MPGWPIRKVMAKPQVRTFFPLFYYNSNNCSQCPVYGSPDAPISPLTLIFESLTTRTPLFGAGNTRNPPNPLNPANYCIFFIIGQKCHQCPQFRPFFTVGHFFREFDRHRKNGTFLTGTHTQSAESGEL